MIVDASALLAILFLEEEAERFADALANDPAPLMSAVNFLEVAIRIDREESILAVQKFEAFMDLAAITLEPVTIAQTRIARRAYVEFGKGRHPASLNFGDCFAYALAKERDLPLLYKGNDFSRTDLKAAA